jgi:hypothetical protein
MNLNRFQYLIQCKLEDYGVLSNVTFQRLNQSKSEAYDDVFVERTETDKVWDLFPVRGQVEEDPTRNIYGPGGGETIGDLQVTFYGEQGATEENGFVNYIPDNADFILWGDERFEVTKHERVMPYGNAQQWGWLVTGTRFS